MYFFIESFSLQKMLAEGLEYCNIFISCFDSHSDGTHPLVSKRCNATFLQSSELIYFLDGLIHFQQIFIFGELFLWLWK